MSVDDRHTGVLRSFGLLTSCSPEVNYFTISRELSQHQKHGVRWWKWAWHTKYRWLTYASCTTFCKDAAWLMHDSLLHINRAHITNYTWNCTIFQKLLSFVCVVCHLYRYWRRLIFARDSIYAIARICYRPSVCLSVCPSVCHTGGSVKNAWS